MKKKLTIGILAHVDAGKTTLSEALLYTAGKLRAIGRVDHGNTYLDTNPMERERKSAGEEDAREHGISFRRRICPILCRLREKKSVLFGRWARKKQKSPCKARGFVIQYKVE